MAPRGRKRKAKTNSNVSQPGTSKSRDVPPLVLDFSEQPEPEPLPPLPAVKILKTRELGITRTNHNFLENFKRVKVPFYERERSRKFFSNPRVNHTIYFCRPGINGIIAVWYVYVDNFPSTAVGFLHYDINQIPFETGYIAASETVNDACQLHANPNSFVCTSTFVGGAGLLQLALPREQNTLNICPFKVVKYSHPNSKPFYCCKTNGFLDRIAVGSVNEVCLYSVNGFEEARPMKENIYSVAFNEHGNVMHLGCSNGELVFYDLRERSCFATMKVDNLVIDECLLLSNENYCIVSGPGCMRKIDVRMQSIVTDYPCHNRRSRRVAVSVNEEFNLLTCAGGDEIHRIWCLNSGKYLHSFRPPSTYPARGCFVPDSPTAKIHIIQDNYIHVYSMIRSEKPKETVLKKAPYLATR